VRFDGKVAIITGAASGIGQQIAVRFAAAGGVPVIADLNFEAAMATARSLDASGHDAFAVSMDVGDEASVDKAIEGTIAKYGRIDVLVSNAGIQIVKPVVDFLFEDWKKMMAIHLDGAFLTTKACLRHMVSGTYRQHHLHRFGAFEGGIRVEGAVCDGEAWPDWVM
jgi:3-hydroxybutyrate dehydrogenase